MKKIILAVVFPLLAVGGYFLVPNLSAPENLGAEVANASEEAVGIVVKNGNKIDEVLAGNFVVDEFVCNPEATTTPQDMCTQVLYQNRPVNVFFSIPEHLSRPNSQFATRSGSFPYAGGVAHVNRADQDIEPRLIQFMLESGNGTYSIIYEP